MLYCLVSNKYEIQIRIDVKRIDGDCVDNDDDDDDDDDDYRGDGVVSYYY